MKMIWILIFCGISLIVTSQKAMRSTLSVSGFSSKLSVSNKVYIIQQSIGQSSVIGNFNSDNIRVRQGFIQPNRTIYIDTAKENHINFNIKIYPNPFVDKLKFEFDRKIEEPISIRLQDLNGKNVFNRRIIDSVQIELDLSFLSSGEYVLSIHSENKQLKELLIKK